MKQLQIWEATLVPESNYFAYLPAMRENLCLHVMHELSRPSCSVALTSRPHKLAQVYFTFYRIEILALYCIDLTQLQYAVTERCSKSAYMVLPRMLHPRAEGREAPRCW